MDVHIYIYAFEIINNCNTQIFNMYCVDKLQFQINEYEKIRNICMCINHNCNFREACYRQRSAEFSISTTEHN